MMERHLYSIGSSKECEERTGRFLSKGSLMRGGELPKEAFAGAAELAREMGLIQWCVEVRDEHAPPASERGPFDIYQYYDGNQTFPHKVEVYVVGR